MKVETQNVINYGGNQYDKRSIIDLPVDVVNNINSKLPGTLIPVSEIKEECSEKGCKIKPKEKKVSKIKKSKK